MDIASSILLGVVQGATEFLPISSSGHLILVREVLGLNVPGGLAVDAVLQLATALAVLVYFWKDFLKLGRGIFELVLGNGIEAETKIVLFAILLGTIPAAVFGLLLEEYMETTFRTPLFVGTTLLLGALLFYIAEKVATQNKQLTPKKGLWIGFFQALALFPGTSRSGATISGGLIFGLKREDAARFSFLLSFPIIFGSGLIKLFEIAGERADFNIALISGALSAFLIGILAIHFLLRYLRTHTLSLFIWYRVILAGVVFLTLV